MSVPNINPSCQNESTPAGRQIDAAICRAASMAKNKHQNVVRFIVITLFNYCKHIKPYLTVAPIVNVNKHGLQILSVILFSLVLIPLNYYNCLL